MQPNQGVLDAGFLAKKGISLYNWNNLREPGVYVDVRQPRYFRVREPGKVLEDYPAFEEAVSILKKIYKEVEVHFSSYYSSVIRDSEPVLAKISCNPSLNKKRIQEICANTNLPVPD